MMVHPLNASRTWSISKLNVKSTIENPPSFTDTTVMTPIWFWEQALPASPYTRVRIGSPKREPAADFHAGYFPRNIVCDVSRGGYYCQNVIELNQHHQETCKCCVEPVYGIATWMPVFHHNGEVDVSTESNQPSR